MSGTTSNDYGPTNSHSPNIGSTSPKVSTLSIRPSSVFKNAAMNELKKAGGVMRHDLELRLASECYQIRQRRKLQKTMRRRVRAEGKFIEMEHNETLILLAAAQDGKQWINLEVPMGVALANATRDTLRSEEGVLDLQIEECKQKLATLNDRREDIHTRFLEAEQQATLVTNSLNRQGVPIPDPADLQAKIMALRAAMAEKQKKETELASQSELEKADSRVDVDESMELNNETDLFPQSDLEKAGESLEMEMEEDDSDASSEL